MIISSLQLLQEPSGHKKKKWEEINWFRYQISIWKSISTAQFKQIFKLELNTTA